MPVFTYFNKITFQYCFIRVRSVRCDWFKSKWRFLAFHLCHVAITRRSLASLLERLAFFPRNRIIKQHFYSRWRIIGNVCWNLQTFDSKLHFKNVTRFFFFFRLKVVGQEQDSYGGGYNEAESFAGRMTNFDVWDRVLRSPEIQNLFENCEPNFGNLITWLRLLQNINGDITVMSSLRLGEWLNFFYFCVSTPTTLTRSSDCNYNYDKGFTNKKKI